MDLAWSSTGAGELFTGSGSWRAEVKGDKFVLSGSPQGLLIVHLTQLVSIQISAGVFWATCVFDFQKGSHKFSRTVDGIPNEQARQMKRTLAAAIDYIITLERWSASVMASIDISHWIPKSNIPRLLTKFPAPEQKGILSKSLSSSDMPETVLGKSIREHNSKYLQTQIQRLKQFFDTVEKNPLTEEQINACICMDDSVLIVAAAGSGKTSTMVAKTGYVLNEGLATPDQILLLAFNRATANELEERVAEQLCNVPNVDQARSTTFHAFGLDVIAKATGKKPSLAPWVDPSSPGADIRQMANIIHSLSDREPEFKRNWDIFRTIYARDVGKWGEKQEPENFDNGNLGFQTARGEIVKSKEERVIADWLFYHGVNYEYERPYEYETADEKHRQYYPDFYYPDAQIYHEHFALNEHGEAPKEFEGYLQGIEWKRSIHAEKGTVLIETTSHGLFTGESLKGASKNLCSAHPW